MPRKLKPPRERAARALCGLAGHPEDIDFEGKPMWESFLPQVDVVLTTALAPEGWKKGRGLGMRRLSDRDYADELAEAANRISDLDRPDVQILLRRAAIRLRDATPAPLDPQWDDILQSVSAELGYAPTDLVRHIVRDWLAANSYLPAPMLEEDGDTDGAA